MNYYKPWEWYAWKDEGIYMIRVVRWLITSCMCVCVYIYIYFVDRRVNNRTEERKAMPPVELGIGRTDSVSVTKPWSVGSLRIKTDSAPCLQRLYKRRNPRAPQQATHILFHPNPIAKGAGSHGSSTSTPTLKEKLRYIPDSELVIDLVTSSPTLMESNASAGEQLNLSLIPH